MSFNCVAIVTSLGAFAAGSLRVVETPGAFTCDGIATLSNIRINAIIAFTSMTSSSNNKWLAEMVLLALATVASCQRLKEVQLRSKNEVNPTGPNCFQ